MNIRMDSGRRHPASPRPHASGSIRSAGLVLAALLLFAHAAPVVGQEAARSSAEPDSAALLVEAREAQADFEHFREQRIPPERRRGGRCDDIIGRMCLRFDDDGTEPATEPPQFSMARSDLLLTLSQVAGQIPGDEWVLGQRVYYLGEIERWREAEGLVRTCGGAPEPDWWCTALLGYVQHRRGETVAAAATFRDALAEMPPEEAARWRSPRYLLDDEGLDLFEDSDAPGALRERLWLLSDPLYLVEGNDRLTEQHARRVLVRIREEAANPYGIEWGEDLEQLTLRYGGEVGWSRRQGMPSASVQDTRRIVGHHHPESRDYLPPTDVLRNPVQVAPGAWHLEKDRPRTGYAPPYAPVIEELDVQVARFLRGDSLLVVGAYAPSAEAEAERLANAARAQERPARDNPFAVEEARPDPPRRSGGVEVQGPVESGLFLVPLDGGERHEVRGGEVDGAFRLQAPGGRYVLGLEAWDEGGERAWRSRSGVRTDDVPAGVAAVSDLLLLRADGPVPESVDEAVPQALARLRFTSGETFKVAWELYGLRPGESANVSIVLRPRDESLIRRIGERLNLMDPDEPVVMTWEEPGPEALGALFRAVELRLPELAPGDYRLSVEIALPGRDPLVVSREIEIAG